MTPAGPKWQTLADDLEAEIRAGQHAAGLPGVRDLAETRAVSSTTAARAHRELVRRGLVVAVAGSGTFVADPLPPAAAGGRTLEQRVASPAPWRRDVEGGQALS